MMSKQTLATSQTRQNDYGGCVESFKVYISHGCDQDKKIKK
jgi:hypothetical protein